jgi:hypothetical protein
MRAMVELPTGSTIALIYGVRTLPEEKEPLPITARHFSIKKNNCEGFA